MYDFQIPSNSFKSSEHFMNAAKSMQKVIACREDMTAQNSFGEKNPL